MIKMYIFWKDLGTFRILILEFWYYNIDFGNNFLICTVIYLV